MLIFVGCLYSYGVLINSGSILFWENKSAVMYFRPRGFLLQQSLIKFTVCFVEGSQKV